MKTRHDYAPRYEPAYPTLWELLVLSRGPKILAGATLFFLNFILWQAIIGMV